MSCQASMRDKNELSQAHTHIARAISGCCMTLKAYLDHSRERFLPFLDGAGVEEHRVDLAEVANLIYWMAKIQSQIGIGPRRFGAWDHRLLPSTVSLPSIERAAHEPRARSKALNQMHANYANARYTVVHDSYLINFPWSDDGSPCLAIVLSTWFTRGWTALELAMSKRVKVL
ncbi:hypothetical protein TRIATDRAFT_185877, partial [Trichoderma atroviride IMI 206040]